MSIRNVIFASGTTEKINKDIKVSTKMSVTLGVNRVILSVTLSA